MQAFCSLLIIVSFVAFQDRKIPPPPKPDDDPAKSVIDELLNKEVPTKKASEQPAKETEKKESSAPGKKESAATESKKATSENNSKEVPKESPPQRKPAPPVPVPSDPTESVKPSKLKSRKSSLQDSSRKRQTRDEIVDELVKKGSSKEDSNTTAAPQTMQQRPADQIVDGVVEKGEKSKDEQGQNYFARAKEAERAGDLRLALSLSQKARDLMPGNREVRGYTIALGQELSLLNQANASLTKAKAHIALANSRATELWNAGRYAEAADLLDGVVRAAVLLPKSAEISAAVKQAEVQLEASRQRLANPIKLKAEESVAQKSSGVPKPPVPVEANLADALKSRMNLELSAPENARRLLRVNDADVPAWYAAHKTKLATNMNVNYINDRLTTVLDEISRLTGVQFIIDGPVGNTGIHNTALVDMRISGVAAETILDLACQRTGLEYVMMEKAIVITTPTKASDYLRQLPEALRNNWAASRVLFPDIHTDLLASPPTIASERRASEDRNVPAFLGSGKAFLKHIQDLMK